MLNFILRSGRCNACSTRAWVWLFTLLPLPLLAAAPGSFHSGLAADASPPPVIAYGLDIGGYEMALLRHALSYQEDVQKVDRYPGYLPRGRDFQLIAEGKDMHVLWGSATEAREQLYRAIRIPIYKGLIGWRLAFVSTGNEELLAHVHNSEQLKYYSAGQNSNWTDSKILKANGIEVASGQHRGVLADMLVRQRFDFFPRALVEMDKDKLELAEFNLSVDAHILIRYPSAYYFYVGQSNEDLARKIEFGLEQAINDGSFDQLFQQHFANLLNNYDVKHRRIIELNNPMLPPTTPLGRSELWHQL